MILNAITKWSSGDTKYQNENFVDAKNNKTKTLGLNINPIKVDASDAKIVLHVMWKVMLFLENKNRNQCYVSHLTVKHEGEIVKFGEVIGLPDTCT